MSRTNRRRGGRRRDNEQREPDKRAGQPEADREAQDFARQTGYRPSVNQHQHEPLPASHHADRRQEAVTRNEEHAADRGRAAPSPRARRHTEPGQQPR